ncbi:MAG: site-specific integrase [Verrucomicrobiales bacterium]|nr:site-specific integrase [Verrucomicrobiales bacterium]
MKFDGVRRRVSLATSSKEEAAIKARDLFLSIQARGWEATFAELTPKQAALVARGQSGPTVGEFLTEVERVSGLKPKTLRRYAQYFRMVVAHTQGIPSDKSKYDYAKGGISRWRIKVDNVPLRLLTPSSAEDWKLSYLGKAGEDPQSKASSRRSFNAVLRHCKSLFSRKVICKPNFGIIVPRFPIKDPQVGIREVFWFETLGFEKNGSVKFRAPNGVTYEGLLKSAREELRASDPDAYLLLLLCLCAGLRRAEADNLLWTQVCKGESAIIVEATEFHQPKHDSGGTVYVDEAMIEELLSFKVRSDGVFVVNATRRWNGALYPRYRCQLHWDTLQAWLTGKGITARKKVHELRKLFGDAIVKQSGIYAGSAQLRHSSIQMTANHYADPRSRAVLPIGHLMGPVKTNQ